MLEKLDLSILADRWPTPTLGATVLKEASADWQVLLQSDDFKNCKSLRHNAIAHTLMLKSPTVQYELLLPAAQRSRKAHASGPANLRLRRAFIP